MYLFRLTPFLFILLMACAGFAQEDGLFHESYSLHLKNNQSQNFKGEIYSFINHSSETWEPDKKTYQGTKNLLEFSRNNIVPSFGVLSKFGGPSPQYFTPSEVLYTVESDAGQVRYKFPNAKSFLIAGGNLGLCLCELLRDLIKGSVHKNNRRIQFFLITDAIYETKVSWPPFHPPAQSAGKQYTLEELAQRSIEDRSMITEYFKYFIIGYKQAFCPSQNYFKVPNIDKKYFHFTLFDGTEKLADYSDGSLYTVDFILTPSSQLDAVLKAWKRDSLLPINRPELIGR